MCLLILAVDQSPQYPLVVIANRDEDHQRPAAAAEFWLDQPQVIGGRDLLRNGTWLALHRGGKFAAITNFREDSFAEYPHSRGDLVVEYLADNQSAETFCSDIQQRCHEYAGFNLIVGEIGKPFSYVSNRSAGQQLTQGVFGISNGTLDNQWPKVVRGKTQLQHWLGRDDELEALFSVLAHRNGNTGSNEEVTEQARSDAFIVNSSYGTRASTCIVVDATGRVRFEERRFDALGQTTGASSFEFALET